MIALPSRSFDVFNGDADGLCALHQLRLAQPRTGELITGTKRDIALLCRVKAQPGDQVTVLDISLDRNRAALSRLLFDGARVIYFDHHYAGDIPKHPDLVSQIDTSADTCTSAIVDRYLGGRFRAWAATAAYGDGMPELGEKLARQVGLDCGQTAKIQQLGELLNYNAYGESVEDLYYHPAELYCLLRPYPDPLDFIGQCDAFARLEAGYARDMLAADSMRPARETHSSLLLALPDEPWARRMTGPLANRWAREHPAKALAVLTPTRGGTYTVSIRAPKVRPIGAQLLAREFGGGGREASAGIDGLSASDIGRFATSFERYFTA